MCDRLEHCEYFGTDRAYPFDWWIAPALSVLNMLRPDFHFNASTDDLLVTQPVSGEANTVLNRRLNILHHHDFQRDESGNVRVVSNEAIAALNAKYQKLFARMRRDIAVARNPAFCVVYVRSGAAYGDSGATLLPEAKELLRPIFDVEFAEHIKILVGPKVRLLVLTPGSRDHVRSLSSNAIALEMIDSGRRVQGAPASAEPIHDYVRGFEKVGFTRKRGHDTN